MVMKAEPAYDELNVLFERFDNASNQLTKDYETSPLNLYESPAELFLSVRFLMFPAGRMFFPKFVMLFLNWDAVVVTSPYKFMHLFFQVLLYLYDLVRSATL